MKAKLRWIHRSIILIVAIFGVGCLFSLTGCVVGSVVGAGVGIGATAVGTAGKAAIKTTGAAVDVVIPDGDKKDKNEDDS